MVTQLTNKIADIQLKKDLLSFHFIKAPDTQLKMDLLSHLQRYPRAKFSPGAMSHAVSGVRKVDLQEALEGLVTDEFVEKHVQHGQLFYCLR